jgi:probable F420-dependent oxidoreductase
MRVYAQMELRSNRYTLHEAVAYLKRVEALGYDGVHVSETIHDIYTIAALAALHTEKLTIRTAIALAFPRSPTITAYAAWDIAKASGGRFQLGLGTQIRQNIEDRYGIPWSDPVGRLREYIETLDALYESFRTGGQPNYVGRYYRATRMQPYFNPGPDEETAAPPTWLGGVNSKVCQLAGELAQGFITHPTNSSPRYLTEVCLPNIAAGAARAGRTVSDIELVICTEVAAGATVADLVAEQARQRKLLAFLYSTPAYGRTLELYGWDDLGDRLRRVIREQRWGELETVLPEEIVETLVPTALYEELPAVLIERYGTIAAGITVQPPDDPADDARFSEVIKALQNAQARPAC